MRCRRLRKRESGFRWASCAGMTRLTLPPANGSKREKLASPWSLSPSGATRTCLRIGAYQSGINGMLFYNSTIHDFDLARWLTHDEVAEVHSFATVAIRPEIAEFGDVVAGAVNLRFGRGRHRKCRVVCAVPVRLRRPHRDRGLQGIDSDRNPAAKLRYLPQAEPRQLRVRGSLPFPFSRCLSSRGDRLRRHHPERPRASRHRRRWPARSRDRGCRREVASGRYPLPRRPSAKSCRSSRPQDGFVVSWKCEKIPER